ncbi:MAG TPA: SprT family zinc-dependent metalloprotease [Gemmatimonadaceae bacterium]|nr:SprT family zinc-dependent metalloprotease [Gemmatimonadaceae bacterium]
MVTTTIELGEVLIELTLKPVRNVHLAVHPPAGHVTLVAPTDTRLDVARAYAVTRLPWIRQQQARFGGQAREAPLRYVERESHYLWGRRHLLSIVERAAKPGATVDHRRIVLTVRPGSGVAKRREVMHAWYRSHLHRAIPPLIASWERKLGVLVSGYYLQRMKTRWGACNHRAGTIRINTELVKKPRDLLEYVIVHEMLHLIEPTHSIRFLDLLDGFCPTWREARAELNELPIASGTWSRE